MKKYLIVGPVGEIIHRNNNKATENMKDYIVIIINNNNYQGTKTKTRTKQRRIIEHISNNKDMKGTAYYWKWREHQELHVVISDGLLVLVDSDKTIRVIKPFLQTQMQSSSPYSYFFVLVPL